MICPIITVRCLLAATCPEARLDNDPALLQVVALLAFSCRTKLWPTAVSTEPQVTIKHAAKLFTAALLLFNNAAISILCRTNKQECSGAAVGGHLDLLRWAHSMECPWDESTCAAAALGGRVDVIEFARSKGCPWNSWSCCQAAMGGHLDVLQFLRRNGCPWCEETCAGAAQVCSVDQ